MKKLLFLQCLTLPLSILGAALPLSLFIAGCGGGGGSSLSPNPTPISGNYKLSGNLSFSNVTAGSTLITTPLNSFNTLNQSGGFINTNFSGNTKQELSLGATSGVTASGGPLRYLNFFLTPDIDLLGVSGLFFVGQSLAVNEGNRTLQLTQFRGNLAESWRATSGEIVVRSISSNSITVELKNARLTPTTMSGGTGSFTINGTLTATGLKVVNVVNP